MDPIFGESYWGDLNKPSNLRIIAAIGVGGELEDITNSPNIWVDRESVVIERINEDGASASLSFDIILPTGAYSGIPTNMYVGVDDPTTLNDGGGALGYFAGYTMNPSSGQEPGEERVIAMRCSDYGVLAHKPPKQITIQYPPGEGTPVVNTNVADSIVAGTDVVVTPGSLRHLYVGKKVFAQNSDGSNRERIEVKTIDYDAGTFTADFTTDKTSTETNVPLSLHALGSQEIEPEDMTNIGLGSLLYCKKNYGVQNIGNEWVVVTAVTATTFTAFFTAWKTHDWTVRSEWQLVGGISDKELLADGWSQHIDSVNPSTGALEMTLVEIPSLLDYCYNDEGFTVSKDGIEEVTLSLPHGKWEAASPADVFQWVVEQNVDPTKAPRWYFTFVQPGDTFISTMLPLARYYDSKAPGLVASVSLTDTSSAINVDEEARYSGYTRSEDGIQFANKQTVMGGNYSIGVWVDQDSIDDPLADNFVGRVIEARVVVDPSLPTNAACETKAAEIANSLRLSSRIRPINLDTYAQLDPYILYEPQAVEFEAIHEVGLGADPFEVTRVVLSFAEQVAKYTFQLGLPQPIRNVAQRSSDVYHKGNVVVGTTGKVLSVGPAISRLVSSHTMVDSGADLYIVDATDSGFGGVILQLPPAHLHRGLPLTIKAPPNASGATRIRAYVTPDVVDDIDGEDEIFLYAGEAVQIQSIGEYDQFGHGSSWNLVGTVGNVGGSLISNPMTTIGDMVTGLDGGLPARLPIGTDGQVLTVLPDLGLDLVPTWADPPTSVLHVLLNLYAYTIYTPPVLAAGSLLVLHIQQDSIGGRALVFGSPIHYPGGIVPTASLAPNARDVAVFESDGTEWYLLLWNLEYAEVAPTLLSDDLLWLIGDTITSDPVDEWPDSTVNNNDGVQATGANQPIEGPTLNGHKTLQFDETNDRLDTSLDITGDEGGAQGGISICLVVNPDTGGSGSRVILGGDNPDFWIGLDNDNYFVSVVSGETDTGPAVSGWSIIQLRVSDDFGWLWWVDGALQGGDDSGNGPGVVYIGPFGGLIAEVRIASGQVDMALQLAELQAKYGI